MTNKTRRWLMWVIIVGVLVAGAYAVSEGELFRGKAAGQPGELWPD